ncbi:hypothetical protein V6C27_06995 [Peptococcaceae bacterium 1198_IL3148]
MLVSEKLGKLLVSFCPGEAVGLYSEGEEAIKNIACALGDYSDRVFDMYLEFSSFADQGLLLRKEYGHVKGAIAVSFFYKSDVRLKTQRQKIIDLLLKNYLQSSVYPRPGIYVVKDKNNNCQLICKNNLNFVLTKRLQRY